MTGMRLFPVGLEENGRPVGRRAGKRIGKLRRNGIVLIAGAFDSPFAVTASGTARDEK